MMAKDMHVDDIMPLQEVREMSEALVRWQLESKDLIREIALQLGWIVQYVMDDDGNVVDIRYKPITDKPVINEKGMRTIVKIISSNVNKNTFLADLTKSEAMDIAYRIATALLDDFILHFEEYDIGSIAKIEEVLYIVENVCEVALTRGCGGRTLEHLSTVQRFVERVQEVTERGKRRFI